MPVQRRQGRQQAEAEPVRFRGELRDRHTTGEGCEYVRITLIPTGNGEADNVIDAEFLFPKGGIHPSAFLSPHR